MCAYRNPDHYARIGSVQRAQSSNVGTSAQPELRFSPTCAKNTPTSCRIDFGPQIQFRQLLSYGFDFVPPAVPSTSVYAVRAFSPRIGSARCAQV